MNSKLSLLFNFWFLVTSVSVAQSQGPLSPTGLTTDLLEHTGTVWSQGYPTNHILSPVDNTPQLPVILSRQPFFGWIVKDTRPGILQTGYQILVASKVQFLLSDSADMWNSGQVPGDNSVAVKYDGKELVPGHNYFWKVRTWNNGTPAPFSEIRPFKMAEELSDYGSARYPVEKTDEYAAEIKKISNGLFFVDFGKASFGRIRWTLNSSGSDTLFIRLGEALKEGRIDRNPGGTVRYREMKLPVLPGIHTYTVLVPADKRNTGPAAIKMPSYIGEVMPFRYCEIEGVNGNLQKCDMVRETAHYPFDDDAATFSSSDKVLNDIWELCKYSIKATSFAGIYVDGDRERIPYEADAFLTQLCHYSVDREFSMARYSQEYLITHATWPTEWIMQSVIMAYNDYLYTGNPAFLKRYYGDIKAKALLALRDNNNLISTKTGKQTQGLMEAVHYNGKELKDIVDWPQTGILGLGKNEPGETDGFVFADYNTVVNAYHYKALTSLAAIALALGNTEESRLFSRQAEETRQAINRWMFDPKRNVYTDGIGTTHASLHANMFVLAFGIVPEKYRSRVMDFIRSRGMACSVYGSQFLMDAIYNAGDPGYGLSLLTSRAERSWAHMIYDVGSTITMEAWDNKYKPNQDWNHAWGAAPANLIPRKILGVEPMEPGFRKIRIKPQPGSLEKVDMTIPTVRGSVHIAMYNKPNELFELNVTLPANTITEVYLPWTGNKQVVTLDNHSVKVFKEGSFLKFENLGSGEHVIRVSL